MRQLLFCLLFLFGLNLFGQNNLTDKMIDASLSSEITHKPAKRKLLSFKKRAARYNPATYISAGLLYLYQNLISEQFQAECTYEISCSEYTKQSIQSSGLFIGTLKGFNQLSECFDGAKYEHPRLFVNEHTNKIINSDHDETK